ncbi:MAG: carboxypeptidase M32 [Pseudomonadota bacterium]
MSKNYHNLEKIFAKVNTVNQISSVLSWDTATMMPKGSSESRGEQMVYLSEHIRGIIFTPEVEDNIKEAFNEPNTLNPWQIANLKSMQRSFNDYASIPAELQQKFILTCNRSEMAWREARSKKDFQVFLPLFSEVIKLTQEIASHRSEYMDIKDPYEALVDIYDPGRRLSEIDSAFAKLEEFLPNFIEKVRSKQGDNPDLDGDFNVATQEVLGREIMKTFNFDFNSGRLDISMHPFCGGYSEDVRITTRYNPNNLFTGLYGVMHETGHALYEQNRPKDWITQPVSAALGMSMHESQSLLAENQIGLSKAFISFLQPKIVQLFNLSPEVFSVSNIYKHLTHIAPSFIRVEADEVTYPLHVILRYKLEKQLLRGDIEPSDIPEVWNKEFTEKFGITPTNDAEGCLQDIHWAWGSLGYFPSYTLGTMTAAQIMHKIRQITPNIDDDVVNGNVSNIYNWLRDNIHSQGSLFASSDQLLENATGEKLNPEYFIKYLQDRYDK